MSGLNRSVAKLFFLFSKALFVCIILFCCTGISSSAGGDCLSLHKGEYHLDQSIVYYEDVDADLSLNDVRDENRVSWTPLKASVPSFGFSKSAYWLKIDLCRPPGTEGEKVLVINYPLLDSIDLFAVVNHQVVYENHTGDMIPFSQRPEKHHSYIFYLPDFKSPADIFIRVQTESAVQIPVELFTRAGFFEDNQKTLLIQGCYFGIILAMIFYNLFLFFTIREKSYLLYVLFTMNYFCFQGILQGFFQQFIFDSVWWQNNGFLFFGFTSIFFANLFAVSFLNLRKTQPVFSFILWALSAVAFLSVICASFLPYTTMVKVMLALAIPSAITIMTIGFKLWWAGHLPARIFTLAWSTLLVSFVLASFGKFGLLPRVFLTENIMQIGGVLEVILLSISLGDRINEEKRQLIIVEKNLSSSLEEKVKERTIALNQALENLEAANIRLDRISRTDALTQVSNRRAFDDHVDMEYKNAARGDEPLALIMIDIDHFKQFNDTYGHQTGDRVLQKVAKKIRRQVNRPRDKVFRYGGEEFAAVLNNTNLSGAVTVAEKMRTAVEESGIDIKGKFVSVTISAGVSVYQAKEPHALVQTLEGFIELADTHLYKAKSDGRNRVMA